MSKIKMILGVLTLSIASNYAMADDPVTSPTTQGNVTFTGELITDTCSIASDSRDITVVLPTISTQTLEKSGDTAGSKYFDINVEDCPASILKVGAHFEAIGNSGVDSTTGNLKNSLSDTTAATEVQVRLYNSDQKQLNLGDTGSFFDVKDSKARLRYYGGYYATGKTTAGKFQAKMLYTLAYP